MADAAPVTVQVHELCAYLDLTPRRVQQLVKEGVLPKAERGQYPLLPCIHAYLTYWKSKAQAPERTSPGQGALVDAKTRQLLASAAKQELEVEELLGNLIPLAVHQRVIEQLLAQLTNQIKTLPPRWRASLEGLMGVELQTRIDDLVQVELARLQEAALAMDAYAVDDVPDPTPA